MVCAPFHGQRLPLTALQPQTFLGVSPKDGNHFQSKPYEGDSPLFLPHLSATTNSKAQGQGTAQEKESLYSDFQEQSHQPLNHITLSFPYNQKFGAYMF